MIRSILVPTDFSTNAMKAAQYAAEIAIKTGATLYLLHVIEPITDSIRQPYALQEKLQREIANNRLGELEALQRSMQRMYPAITIATELAKADTIAAVHHFAESQKMDLVVMGTKGATGLKEIFMGSVAAGTIGRTKIPVLVVPEKYQFEVPDGILFATNHFEKDKSLLNSLVDVSSIFSASIHVAVFVDTDTAAATDYIYNTMQLNLYLDFLKKAYPGIYFKGELLEGSEFEETIEKYVTTNEVDMITMVTYPKSFWERLMKKSTTRQMAFHSKVPLLAIPSNG